MRTALVIGGGIVGTAAAFRMQRRGIATTLVDPDALPEPASWGNAGHIAVEQGAPLASMESVVQAPGRLLRRDGALSLPLRDAAAWMPFGVRLVAASRPSRFEAGRRALNGLLSHALPAWRRLAADLGMNGLLRENGHYLVFEKPGAAPAAMARLLDQPSPNVTYRRPDEDQRNAIAALIGRVPAGVLFCDGSAQVTHLPDLMAGLRSAFLAAGGAACRARVASLGRREGATVVTLEDGRRLAADIVVAAAGVWSGRLLARLGHKVPIIAERGYHLHAPLHRWPASLPSIVFEDRALFATPFGNGLRVSSFLEFSRPERPADPRKWRHLRTHVAELNLPMEGTLEEWMGSRPTLPDYLPAIGRSDRAPGLLYAFGHQHLGLTLAAVTAEAIATLAEGTAPTVALAPFAIERFG